MPETPSPEELAFLHAEEALLAQIIVSLKQAANGRSLNFHRIGERLKALREDATKAKNADLPALFDQMNTQRALLEIKPPEELPDERAPYFAHLRLHEDGRAKDVLLGPYSFLDGPAPIVDWRHAPRARIYFNYKAGDEYEEELPSRIVSGQVLDRIIVTMHASTLIGVDRNGQGFAKDESGQWQRAERGLIPSFAGGAGSAQRGQGLGTGQAGRMGPEVAALLDREQYALLESAGDEPLLILGGAGCGKTTVALHRLAALNFRDPVLYDAKKMGVIVPETGLMHLSQKLLGALGLGEVQTNTFDQWVEHQARLFLRTLPRRVCDSTPVAVTKLKRHPAMQAGFSMLIARRAEELAQGMAKTLRQSDDQQTMVRTRTDLNLRERLELAESEYLESFEQARAHWNPSLRQLAVNFFQEQRKRLWDLNNDRAELFLQRPLLEAVVAAAGGTLPATSIDAVLRHSLEQFGTINSLSMYADVDTDRLQAVTGHNLIDEAQNEKAGTIDVEDFAISIALAIAKTGRTQAPLGRLRTYSHLVLDEAQELAPLELHVIGQSLSSGGSVTIAGDAAQQSDPHATFQSWEEQLLHLGVPLVRANHLRTSYRSTAPIATFAHQLLGPLAPAELPLTSRDGVPVARSLLPSDGHVVIFLREALQDLLAREPKAAVAVICRHDASATSFYEPLADLDGVRLVLDGDFSFRPGIDVTTAQGVKGLEFDYVIIPDASSLHYPDTPHDRRLLHVAATRAIHQLWVIGIGRDSPILASLSH